MRAEIVAEIASLEAVLAASATNDDQNASEEEQMAASLTLSEYEARIKRRRAEREPITGDCNIPTSSPPFLDYTHSTQRILPHKFYMQLLTYPINHRSIARRTTRTKKYELG